ncbi:hypothetical protein SCMU_05940 [Sinomonas cyclohexanicum]|uniref:Uncharacterized protein n=1 Tax=Sinomonas cyclohexanicum TaxID=322009 RepID=A0ABM7PRC9_SINCY|nr:hypothetical protein [Corynebacterium cyclohexanicum]BCT74752.1 hypothetical protein SCMU_05940 [Corynebacterium cyclohexanicum]
MSDIYRTRHDPSAAPVPSMEAEEEAENEVWDDEGGHAPRDSGGGPGPEGEEAPGGGSRGTAGTT